MDQHTRKNIDKEIERTLKEAGIIEPPVCIDDVLVHLELNREFYDLEDATFLRKFWHKVKIGGEKLISIVRKIKLAAVWLPDEDRIIVDSSLPKPKQEWASFHDTVHRILDWHRPLFLGDTAQSLDPAFQEQLEAEANYGASALMFCGRRFTIDARDVTLDWAGLEAMKMRYGDKSYVTTLRRFVEHGQDHPMALLISSPHWMRKPADQPNRCRHFVQSRRFTKEFATVTASNLLAAVDGYTIPRVGGRVADFTYCLKNENGDPHEFHAESFYNRHYVLTLFVQSRRMGAQRIVVPLDL